MAMIATGKLRSASQGAGKTVWLYAIARLVVPLKQRKDQHPLFIGTGYCPILHAVNTT